MQIETVKRVRGPTAPVAATNARRALATAIDAALGLALTWGMRRGRSGVMDSEGVQRVARAARWMNVFGPSSELVREQIGSPGQRLAGIRTVDRRTGARVAWWRTLLLVVMSGVGAVISERNAQGADPEVQRRREEFGRELRAAASGPAGDPQARATAIRELYSRYHVEAAPWRRVGPIVALALLTSLLRRRLAPTTEVSVRAGRR